MKQVFFLILLSFSIGQTVLGQNLGAAQRGQRGFSPNVPNTAQANPEPPDVNLLSQERADMYQEILEIDDFQKEVLKTFLKDYYGATSEIGFDTNLKFEDKQKGINDQKKILEKNLSNVFSEEQVEIVMTEEQFGSKSKELKKEKKKEKRKKKKEDKNKS